MSHFTKPTLHPVTGELELAEWLDDYFGKHRYGVRFADGVVVEETEIRKSIMTMSERIVAAKEVIQWATLVQGDVMRIIELVQGNMEFFNARSGESAVHAAANKLESLIQDDRINTSDPRTATHS